MKLEYFYFSIEIITSRDIIDSMVEDYLFTQNNYFFN